MQLFFLFPVLWPHQFSKPSCTQSTSNLLFWAYFSICENPNNHSSCGSSHVITTFSFFLSFLGIGFLFCTPCCTGGTWNCNSTLDTMYPCFDYYREGEVMPSCAYLGFQRTLLHVFPCVLSLCFLVTSGSPHKPILLIALLIYGSMHATFPHMLLCTTPTFS